MINLLPWRAELRAKRKKEFLMATLGAVLLGAALTFGTKFYYQSRIVNQETRNQMLRTEITELDQKIADIRELEARKARLIARMEIIEQLQTSRPESVHLVDEAVSVLPEGTYLTALTQEDARVTFVGTTESSTRVSTLMNSINDSAWLRIPELGGIDYPSERRGNFTVRATQVRMNEDEEELR
jgi:type IV pilus assembly protein PilN